VRQHSVVQTGSAPKAPFQQRRISGVSRQWNSHGATGIERFDEITGGGLAHRRADSRHLRQELEFQRDEAKAWVETLQRAIAHQEAEMHRLEEQELARQEQIRDEFEALQQLHCGDRKGLGCDEE
jgi:hypothetical protein